jgi:ADP-L-glycero-D-manno-heptose 6-epimerase
VFVVTGGAGFIGSNVAAELAVKKRADVAIVDTLGQTEKWRNISKLPLQSIVSPEGMFRFLQKWWKSIEAIIHLGAISQTTEKDADLIVRTNFTLSQDLWEFCSANDIPLIYASSAATYGGGEQGFKDSFTEQDLFKLRPMNAYGWSKHLFDCWVLKKVEKRETPRQWAGLKFFNVYGPNEYHKGSQQSVIAHVFPYAQAGQPCKLFKSYNPAYEHGKQLRDFVWVGDCVNVISWLISNPKVCGLFNVGSGKARSFFDLARNVYLALDTQPQIEYVDMPSELQAKYQYFTQADISKLRQSGFSCQMTSLEDGVSQYVRNYLRLDDQYL